MSTPTKFQTYREARDAKRAHDRANGLQRRARLRELGLCHRCERNKPKRGVWCEDCRSRHNTVDTHVSMQGPGKQARVDLGLALLSCHAVPGIEYTLEEIAAWAGCTHQRIRQIEQRAMKNLRRALAIHGDSDVRESVRELLGRKGAAA